MIKNHYDVIFLGSNLSTWVAASLLAKTGLRVMSFSSPCGPCPPFIPSSLFLERILEQLAERTLNHQAIHLHVVNQHTRLECNGPLSLIEECQREFPSCHAEVVHLLETLQQWGDALQRAVLATGGLPLFGLGQRLQFRKWLLKEKVPAKIIQQPLDDLLSTIDDAGTQKALSSLFCGLSLAENSEHLTVAEAAMLWSDLCRNKHFSGPALCSLLEQRYDQFHGATDELSAIKSIKQQNDSDLVVNMKGNRSCSADYYIVADKQAHETLPWQSEYPQSRLLTLTASRLEPAPPALLAQTLIIGDPPVVRLIFNDETQGCTIESPVGGGENMYTFLGEKISSILPFSRYELESSRSATSLDGNQNIPPVTFPGNETRIKPRRNVFLCSGRLIVPHLDATGEVLTGLSLANHLTAGNSK